MLFLAYTPLIARVYPSVLFSTVFSEMNRNSVLHWTKSTGQLAEPKRA